LLHHVLLGVHVTAGALGLLLGAVVIWSGRESPLLDRGSGAYHWIVLVVSLSAVGLLALDWPELWWLALLAAFAYALALLGYLAPRRRFGGWHAAYAHGQGGSYIALVTALLVVALTVDGPVGGAAAALAWVLPTLVGTSLIERWRRRLIAHDRDSELLTTPRPTTARRGGGGGG
jgi:signal transduction histidine kinase